MGVIKCIQRWILINIIVISDPDLDQVIFLLKCVYLEIGMLDPIIISYKPTTNVSVTY